jgi:ATP-dependent Clp protease protease subunit
MITTPKTYWYTRMDGDEEKDEEATKTPQSLPVDKHLFEARNVLITGTITQELARDVTGRLMALSHVSKAPINVIVCSPGGHVESGDMIHDMIRFVDAPVNMIGVGWVASAGALIYISVPVERRFCLPNTRFLLHQPSGGAGGPVTDIEIQAREILKMRDRLNQMFAKATGQSLDRIETDTDRDFWMSPEEGIKYGLVGKVIHNVSELA